MRKSSRVTLVLVGLAALGGCQRGEEPQRQVYASKEDCLADWNNKPADCTPATQPAHAANGFWYGPILFGSRWGYSPFSGGGRSVGHTGAWGSSSSITRGGFGSSARGGLGSAHGSMGG